MQVGPSESDFNCDVVIAARSVLSAKELAYFNGYYIEQSSMVPTDKEMNRAIAHKVGKCFIDRRIFPCESYFASAQFAARSLPGKRISRT